MFLLNITKSNNFLTSGKLANHFMWLVGRMPSNRNMGLPVKWSLGATPFIDHGSIVNPNVPKLALA